MKKNTMMTLVNYFAFQNGLPSDVADAVDELKAELNRGAEKAQKNRELYESVKPIVMDGFRSAGEPITIAGLYEKIKDNLPDGFGKSKVQYAVTRLWIDELGKNEGKINAYFLPKEGE